MPQAALVQFSTLNQYDNEDVLDWEDRVWKLAYQAFPYSDPDEIERQVISRFILGLADKEAAKFLACQEIDSMTSMLKKYRMFMHAKTYARVSTGCSSNGKSI